MNYIKKLQRENEEMRRILKRIEDTAQSFRVELFSDKFTGVDCNGDRKDWISTKDVDQWLQKLHSQAMNGC